MRLMQINSLSMYFGFDQNTIKVHNWCMSTPNLTLPPIALSALPERTKDFLIALCNQENIAPEEALKRTLDLAAARAGFAPKPEPEDARREAALVA